MANYVIAASPRNRGADDEINVEAEGVELTPSSFLGRN